MKLRPKNVIRKITIGEIIEELFKQDYSEYLSRDFLSNRGTAMRKIDEAIKYVLGYDTDTLLEEMFEEEDINWLKEKVFDIMYSIAILDEECK